MLIVLVHGLARTPLSLFGLAPALRRAGHHTRFFGYSPTLESLPRVVRRLTERLRSLAHMRSKTYRTSARTDKLTRVLERLMPASLIARATRRSPPRMAVLSRA